MPSLPFPTPLALRPGPFALVAAGAFLLSGCAEPSGPTTQELAAMLAPSPTGAATATHAPDIEELRFSGKTRSCSPSLDTDLDGTWETSAPRVKVADGAAEIGLRNADGSGQTPVSVRVTTPGDEVYTATATLSDADWTTLVFPGDFEAGPSWIGTGAHTAVWSVGDDSAFVSCDGFVGA